MKTLVMMAAAAIGLYAYAGTSADARWIWHPGDYGIWWGNALQSRRLQWGAQLTPSWPFYEPHSRIIFRKGGLKLNADEPLEVRCDGTAAVCYFDAKGAYRESSAIRGRFTLPKKAVKIEIKIHNALRPPSIWISGKHLKTDSSWTATWTCTRDDSDDLPCESSARFTDPATPPGLARLPTRRKDPVRAERTADGGILADFGEETYGYLRLSGVTGRGTAKAIFAESEAEARAVELANTKRGALDGWEMIELEPAAEYRHPVPRGFRYVRIVPVEGDAAVASVAMDYEWKDVPLKGSFRCSDETVNRIWDVSAHTLELTCREVFIEGVKRDHWTWSGDAVQSFLMNYYTFADYDGCRDTLWTLRGKDPVKVHLNRIMDYTFYWFDAVEKYLVYSGDAHFARQVYPRLKSLMEFALSRLDADGRPTDCEGDWMFIDWAPVRLPNYGGVTSFEQMLLARALEAAASVADRVGDTAYAESCRERAERLRAEIVPRYWNAGKGGLMHIIYKDGRTDPLITRYPNIFGLLHGYFDDGRRKSVVENVLMNDAVMKIQTPYMRFYELESLCVLGMQRRVMSEIKSYWGGMLDLGATSFWELYNPGDSGEKHYAMYGRRFGKSLCHAWGASPVYLIGRYFLGVKPVKAGFAEYEVRPNLGGLEWMEGDVPAPFGKIRVRADASGIRVRSDGGRGMLVLPDGRRIPIPAATTIEAAAK